MQSRRVLSTSTAVVLFASMAASAVPVSAQQPPWEVEVHVGALLTNNPSDGQGALPGPGEPFSTAGGPSRKVPSWYFGDGARLLNDVIGIVTSAGPVDRIVPLDPVLAGPLAERLPGIPIGIRISRAIGRRMRAEFSLDVSQGRLETRRDALDGIEVSRASFERAWQAVLLDEPATFVAPQVSSTSTAHDEGRQVLTTGTLHIDLRAEGTLIPFVTGGAGVVSSVGTSPSVTLEGRYGFRVFDTFPLEEIDTVILRHAADDHVFVGVVGGGFRYFMTPRRGLRVDIRAHVGKNPSRTLISAHPRSTPTPPLQTFLFSRTTPSLQISNHPNYPSTLSGSLTDFESFTASGTSRPVSVTVGFFWRL